MPNPKWCMMCGEAEMPDVCIKIGRTKDGKLEWKGPSRAALRRKKVIVCANCWRVATWGT